MAMIRKLLTMTEEQEKRLNVMAAGNASGFVQVIIDKLWERSQGDAVKFTESESLHSERVQKR